MLPCVNGKISIHSRHTARVTRGTTLSTVELVPPIARRYSGPLQDQRTPGWRCWTPTTPVSLAIPVVALAGLVIGVVPASASTVAPDHAIVCHYSPDVPYQYGRGAPVNAEAHITCSPDAPDVSSTTIRIWRYDTHRRQYYLVAEKTSNQRGTNWWISTKGNCTAQIAYPMHTEVINDSFHGNWGHTDVNSGTVTLYC